jgi:hypothetical protein
MNNMENFAENISQIDTLEIKNGTNIITFKKTAMDELQKNNYQEINLGISSNTISALKLNGLFTATVSGLQLIQIANGPAAETVFELKSAFSYINIDARGSNGLAEFMPALIMFTREIIVKHFNNIAQQLNDNTKNYEEITTFVPHIKGGIGVEYAKDALMQLCNVEYPGLEHLAQLKIIQNAIRPIYFEYLVAFTDVGITKVSNKIMEVIERVVEDLENINDDNIREFDTSNHPIVKPFQVCNSIEASESVFLTDFYLTINAGKVSYLLCIIEFILNVRMNIKNNNINSRVCELCNMLKQNTKDDFFAFSKGEKWLNKYFDLFINTANEFETNFNTIANKKMTQNTENTALTGDAFSMALEIHKKLKSWENFRGNRISLKEGTKKEMLEKAQAQIENMLSIKTKLIEYLTQPIEILYAIGEDGKESIFVKQKGGQNE